MNGRFRTDRRPMTTLTRGLLCLLLGATIPPALAQTKPAAPAAPIGNEPGATTATYGDWTLHCERTGDADKARRFCEVALTVQVPGQQAPVAQLAFGKPAGTDPMRIVAVVPVNVQFPSTVKVSAGDKDPQPLELSWLRCLPGACFAQNLQAGDAVKRWRAEASPGRLAFTDAGGREVAFPISFRGLGQALDALAKENG